MKKFLIILSILLAIALFIDYKNADAFELIPSTGQIADGFLETEYAYLTDIPSGSYLKLIFPDTAETECISEASTDHWIGNNTGFYFFDGSPGDLLDNGYWRQIGTFTLNLYANSSCDEVIESKSFILTNNLDLITSTSIQELFIEKSTEAGNVMMKGLIIILGIAGSLIGLGFGWNKLKQHATGNGDTPMGGSFRYRNLPGDKDYDPSKASYREDRGENVNIPKGGRIF